MTRRRTGSDLGLLPTTDRNSELQELSLRAFQRVLPVSKFLFRDKLAEDFGVDGVLELKMDGCATNLCAQVQLKAVETAKTGREGIVPLQVDVSNVNYLLNGQSPLYVLYVASRDELRYLWARDERRRLDAKKPDWMQQEKVTIHFKKILTSAGVDAIHRRIRQEAQMQRRIHDTLARATTSEDVIIGINPETHASTDPDEIHEMLREGGTTLVASGHASEVLQLFAFMRADQAAEPRLRLVHAYANYVQGRYTGALADLAEAMLEIGQLSPDDRQFLHQLKDASDFQAGRINVVEYQARVKEREGQATGYFLLASRLEHLRHALFSDDEITERAAVLDELRGVVSDIDALPDVSEACKLQARIVLLYGEGGQASGELLRAASIFAARKSMGQMPAPDLVASLLHKRIIPWERSVHEALEEAQRLGHPTLVADLLYTRSMIRVLQACNLEFLRPDVERRTLPVDHFESVVTDVQAAISLYRQVESLEGEVRATLLLADLREIMGQASEAKALAESVLPKAQAMDYVILESRAREHIQGETRFKQAKAKINEAYEGDDDYLAVDEGFPLERGATLMLQTLDLPPDRLPVIKRELQSLRDIASERLHWCRHIEMLQDLTHTRSRSTYFFTDPDRHCFCDRFGYESGIGHPDSKAVINSFKQTYCKNCVARDPKVKPKVKPEV